MNDLATLVQEVWDWLYALDPASAFLLALPFMFALAAFLGDWIRDYCYWQNGGAVDCIDSEHRPWTSKKSEDQARVFSQAMPKALTHSSGNVPGHR
jgi:hypothetical protein